MQYENNLPAESQRWGRYVEDELRDIRSGMLKMQQDIANSFRGINASITGLSKQVSDIADLQNSRVLPYGERNGAVNMPTLVNNQAIATIGFSKPSWATNAIVTVMVSGYLVSTNQWSAPMLKVSIPGYGSKSIQMWQTENSSNWSLAGFNGITFTWADDVGELPQNITASVMFDTLGNTAYYLTGAINRQADINGTVLFTRQ